MFFETPLQNQREWPIFVSKISKNDWVCGPFAEYHSLYIQGAVAFQTLDLLWPASIVLTHSVKIINSPCKSFVPSNSSDVKAYNLISNIQITLSTLREMEFLYMLLFVSKLFIPSLSSNEFRGKWIYNVVRKIWPVPADLLGKQVETSGSFNTKGLYFHI